MDGATGLGKWTEEQFIQRFKQYADSNYVAQEIKDNEFNTVMPWIMFSGMTEHDLSSIFTYLKSLEPIENSFIRFVPDQEEK